MFFLIALTINAGLLQAQPTEWALKIGGAGNDYSEDICVDKDDNVYVAGRYRNTIDFQAQQGLSVHPSGASASIDNAYIAKYDPSGKCIWATTIRGNKAEAAASVIVDDAGNVYVTGSFTDTADFYNGTGTKKLTGAGGLDIFLAKYDKDGDCLWVKSMGGNAADRGTKIRLDSKGDILLTGYFSNTAYFNGQSLGDTLMSHNSIVASPIDIFLAKYDSDGNFKWVLGMGNNNLDYAWGMEIDSKDNIYVTGSFQLDVDFNSKGGTPAILISAGSYDIFIAKYDKDGKYQWARRMGGNGIDYGYGIVVDQSDNVIATGRFENTADFNPVSGPAYLTSAGLYDVFITKYDAEGNYIWAKRLGSRVDEECYEIALDRAGNFCIAGTFNKDTVDFSMGAGAPSLIGKGGWDAFVAKYDNNGNYLWAKQIAGVGGDISRGLAIDRSGNALVAGDFSGILRTNLPDGNDSLVNEGSDVFLLKLACVDTSSSELTLATCEGTFTYYDSVYTVSGDYIHVFPNATGCDSTVVLHLTFNHIEKPVIQIKEFTLSVTGTYSDYQWLLDGVVIDGATEPTYLVEANGNYQVAVSDENGCRDTSEVYKVDNHNAIDPVNSRAMAVSIYPNPANDVLYIQSPFDVNITISDLGGRLIRRVSNARALSIKDLHDGMYILNITDIDGNLIKAIKQVKLKK